jgi:guanyl-specific ribonuclease Sa
MSYLSEPDALEAAPAAALMVLLQEMPPLLLLLHRMCDQLWKVIRQLGVCMQEQALAAAQQAANVRVSPAAPPPHKQCAAVDNDTLSGVSSLLCCCLPKPRKCVQLP